MNTTGDRIHVTHVNIRTSIFLVLFQLLFVQIITFIFIIAGYLLILNYGAAANVFLHSIAGLIILVTAFIFYLYLTVFAILQWVNEYYELYRKEFVHKRGIIWRKVEKYSIEHMKFAEVKQDMLGKLFNYGTLSLYDARRIKFLELYLIHSPMQFLEILETINPDLDEMENVIRGDEGLNYT